MFNFWQVSLFFYKYLMCYSMGQRTINKLPMQITRLGTPQVLIPPATLFLTTYPTFLSLAYYPEKNHHSLWYSLRKTIVLS